MEEWGCVVSSWQWKSGQRFFSPGWPCSYNDPVPQSPGGLAQCFFQLPVFLPPVKNCDHRWKAAAQAARDNPKLQFQCWGKWFVQDFTLEDTEQRVADGFDVIIASSIAKQPLAFMKYILVFLVRWNYGIEIWNTNVLPELLWPRHVLGRLDISFKLSYARVPPELSKHELSTPALRVHVYNPS